MRQRPSLARCPRRPPPSISALAGLEPFSGVSCRGEQTAHPRRLLARAAWSHPAPTAPAHPGMERPAPRRHTSVPPPSVESPIVPSRAQRWSLRNTRRIGQRSRHGLRPVLRPIPEPVPRRPILQCPRRVDSVEPASGGSISRRPEQRSAPPVWRPPPASTSPLRRPRSHCRRCCPGRLQSAECAGHHTLLGARLNLGRATAGTPPRSARNAPLPTLLSSTASPVPSAILLAHHGAVDQRQRLGWWRSLTRSA